MRTKLIPYLFIFADFKTLINDDFFFSDEEKRKAGEKNPRIKQALLKEDRSLV